MNLFYSHAENSIIFNSGVDYEKNWFTFGSLRYCKDEPSLKIFFSLYDENIYMVQKRTESRLETECFVLDFFYSDRSGPKLLIMWDFQSVHGSFIGLFPSRQLHVQN